MIPFAQVEAINPNLAEKDFSSNVSTYFKCIAVACHSFRVHNPEIVIKIITNNEVPKSFINLMKALGVEIVAAEFTFNPPKQFGDTFRASFYFFDALRVLAEDSLIIDPDVICLQNLQDMQYSLKDKIAVFRPLFNPDKMVNGITPRQASQIFNEYLGKSNFSNPNHIGGEAIYIPSNSLNFLLDQASKFWEWNINRAKHGLSFLPTEEHILTVLLKSIDCDSLGPFMSRIWTAKSYREIEGELQDIDKMLLWHLPSEKSRGFQKVYSKIFEEKSLQNKSVTRDFYKVEMNLRQNLFQKLIYFFLKKIRK